MDENDHPKGALLFTSAPLLRHSGIKWGKGAPVSRPLDVSNSPCLWTILHPSRWHPFCFIDGRRRARSQRREEAHDERDPNDH